MKEILEYNREEFKKMLDKEIKKFLYRKTGEEPVGLLNPKSQKNYKK